MVKLIKHYQKIPGPWHGSCRFTPTCSNYAIETIERHGALKGGFLALIRILKCNPLFKGGYDPVRGGKNEKEN